MLLAVRASAQVELPAPDPESPIVVSASQAAQWRQGQYEVWLLQGDCLVEQAGHAVRGTEAVLWIKRAELDGDPYHTVLAYVEGDVSISGGSGPQAYRLSDQSWSGERASLRGVDVRVTNPGPEPPTKPQVYLNAVARRDPYAGGVIRRTQFSSFGDAPQVDPLPGGARRLRAYPRSAGVPVQAEWFPNAIGTEWIAVIPVGVNVIIDGVEGFGSLDVSTDRMVIWTQGGQPDFSGEALQDENAPLEIYMEGNVVFRQGDRVIYADRMYYDVRNQTGAIFSAEILTPVPNYQGLLRMRADLVEQISQDRFLAQRAFVTSSRMGRPGYRLQSQNIFLEDRLLPRFNPFTGEGEVNPETGEPVIDHQRLATSRNNLLYLGPVPVFYWPFFATDLEDPSMYLEQIQVRNDRIFGTQVRTEWDLYQLLGWDSAPRGTNWDLSLDYLQERGVGFGTDFQYTRQDLFGIPGFTNGTADLWAINDDGLDRLGSDRMALVPEADFRYRTFGRHRQSLPNNFQLTGELGLISDRNFLEQYFENEWDEFKDQTTGFELKQLYNNMSWSLTSDLRVNDFFTQTQWLPRLDHFWLGQPLAADYLTWFEHSSAAYADLKTASTPTDPADAAKFALLPWEVEGSGERFVTRQELDLPIQLGPVKFVPFILGEAAHWGEDITGDDLQRIYGQAGLRASVPVWSVNPAIESELWNVHGIAHKAVFDFRFSYAEANRDLSELQLYDQLDDDAQEHFRRRFAFNTFGGAGLTPPQFDERFYAVRSGLGEWVTSPSAEVVDDLTVLRMGVRNRWQTKRGVPGQRRIIDWIVLDTHLSYFPDPDRDNFGEDLGLADYDFRWHLGDRTTIVSSGIFDFFDEGQEIFSIGGFLNRPPRGGVYLGFHSLGGPVTNRVLVASYSYRMTPKWISTISTSVDVSGNGNIGQNVSLTRVGESLLVSLGMNVDAYKDNVGVSFMIEPRFLPGGNLSALGGGRIPVAGLYGLE